LPSYEVGMSQRYFCFEGGGIDKFVCQCGQFVLSGYDVLQFLHKLLGGRVSRDSTYLLAIGINHHDGWESQNIKFLHEMSIGRGVKIYLNQGEALDEWVLFGGFEYLAFKFLTWVAPARFKLNEGELVGAEFG